MTKKFYVTLEMSDGTTHQVWTVIIDKKSTAIEGNDLDSIKSRPTLVLAHGWASASLNFVPIIPDLM